MKLGLNVLLSILLLVFGQPIYADELARKTIDGDYSPSNKSLLGEWDLYLPSPDGVERVFAKFEGNQGIYAGTFEGKAGKKELIGVQINGDDFSFQHEVEKFFMTITVEFTGKVQGGRLSGQIDTPKGLKSFEGVRRDI